MSHIPGRLRVRFPVGTFHFNKGLGIEHYLCGFPFIEKVITNPTTGSVLIHYREQAIEETLAAVQSIRLSQLEDRSLALGDYRLLNKQFEYHLLRKIVSKMMLPLVLPVSAYRLVTLVRSLPYLWRMLRSLLRFSVDIHVSDGLGILANLLMRNASGASDVMFFLSLSELLEQYTTQKLELDLSSSLAFTQGEVWVVTEFGDVRQPVSHIQIGDCIRVMSGSAIPVDGQIVEGHAEIDECALTGESRFIEKSVRDSVFAGTVIKEGHIVVRVREVGINTRMHRIVSLIGHAAHLKSTRENQAIRFANRLVPFNLLFTGFVYFTTRDVMKTLATLMVDYSCAIKLSVPLSTMAAIKTLADQQVVVKGGKYLENLEHADVLVFDKTGTLTQAQPTVAAVVPLDEWDEYTLLRHAACIEEHFPHSVATAIVSEAANRGIVHDEWHGEVKYIVAHGIKSELLGEDVVIGSHHFVFEDEQTQCTEEQKELIAHYCNHYSVVYIGKQQKLMGFICIEDPIRPEAAKTVHRLRKAGIKEVMMITGDGARNAAHVANVLGLDYYYSEVQPEQKAELIRHLQRQGRIVAMVGDGINDAIALSVADVSVSLKEASDIAREVSDVVLLGGTLEGLCDIMTVSKQLNRRVRHNTRFIGLFNSSLLLLGAAGMLSFRNTAVLHNLSTFAISLNSVKNYSLNKVDMTGVLFRPSSIAE